MRLFLLDLASRSIKRLVLFFLSAFNLTLSSASLFTSALDSVSSFFCCLKSLFNSAIAGLHSFLSSSISTLMLSVVPRFFSIALLFLSIFFSWPSDLPMAEFNFCSIFFRASWNWFFTSFSNSRLTSSSSLAISLSSSGLLARLFRLFYLSWIFLSTSFIESLSINRSSSMSISDMVCFVYRWQHFRYYRYNVLGSQSQLCGDMSRLKIDQHRQTGKKTTGTMWLRRKGQHIVDVLCLLNYSKHSMKTASGFM